MDFDLTPDQQTLQDAFGQLAGRFRDLPAGFSDYLLEADDLEAALVQSGFLDVASQEGCGALEAVLLIEAIAASPRSVELTASALVAPLAVGKSLPRPIALARKPIAAPIRFLGSERGTLLVDDGSAVQCISTADAQVQKVASHFNYPLGRIDEQSLARAEILDVDIDEFRRLWRLGVAAEIIGAMRLAMEITVEYVKQRRQFGRPLGAFQAIQHRLAESQVMVEGAQLLTYEAAATGCPTSAALALSYAQEAAVRIVYETQQFHGAIGLTLEYPLHLWTYRLRVLVSELGGSTEQALVAANVLWATDKPIEDTFLGRGSAFGSDS